MKSCLVICRSPAGLAVARRLRSGLAIVVASDDPRVHAEAGALPGIRQVCFIEKRESFYHVADEVIRVLAEIDAGLASLDPDGPADLLSWGRNVEGGLTSQRVQDALLLIRSYLELFQHHDAAEIRVISDPAARWEDKVLIACARSRNLPCRIHASQRLACWTRDATARLRPWAVAAYYLYAIVRAGALRWRPIPNPVSPDGAIVFQSNSSLQKHVENIRPLMVALSARGRRVLALCWEASERRRREPACRQFAREQLPVIRLEHSLTFCVVWTSVTTAMRIAWRSRRTPPSWRHLAVEGVPLHALFSPSHAHFFVAELPQRIRYAQALATALGPSRPAALKLAGGPESFEGKAALRVLAARSTTLVFHYWVGTAPEWPYADGQGRIDLFLAKGRHETTLAARDYALAPGQIEITGQARFSGNEKFMAQHPPAQSRQQLGIPANHRRYLGFDPNGALRGYLTVREQSDMTLVLLAVARRHPEAMIVVKPHPSYSIDHLTPFFTQAALANVVVLPRRAPLNHFLNAVDLVVTKYSTLILESALFGRIPISALFDDETRFKIYGDLPAIVRSPLELDALLEKILATDRDFAVWREAELARHRALLPNYYAETRGSPAELAAAMLDNRLNARAI